MDKESLDNKLDIVKNTRDPLKKMLLVVGLLTEVTQNQGIRPILVGGGALEFYTVTIMCIDEK